MADIKFLRSEAVFDNNIEKINPLFSKVKIRVAYTGVNRNNSCISKETFEKALPSIYNCPIIGEFIEQVDDFGSHGGKIIIDDKGVNYVQTTKPYGIIPESSEITWEDVVEENGTINTYLCVTGYLWTGRYEELSTIITDSKSQSMEIVVNEGKTENINGKAVYAVDDFTFSGFCILGNSVEPCFESANIESYSLNKEEFKLQFAEMIQELKESFNTQNQSSKKVDDIDFNKNIKEGGNENLDEKLELLAKYNLTVEQLDFNIEELSLSDLKVKIEEFNHSLENPKDTTEPIKFSATYRQKEEALDNALDPKIEKDEDGNYIYEEYLYVQDFDDEYVFVRKSIWTKDNYESKYGRYTYTFDESTLIATITSEFEEMVRVWLTLEENQKLQDERNTVVEEFEAYKKEYCTINSEVERLQKFEKQVLTEQREIAEQELFALYDEKLGVNEKYIELKANASNYSIEDLEKEIALVFARQQNFALNTNKKDKTVVKFNVKENNDTKPEVYGGIVGKFLSKEKEI